MFKELIDLINQAIPELRSSTRQESWDLATALQKLVKQPNTALSCLTPDIPPLEQATYVVSIVSTLEQCAKGLDGADHLDMLIQALIVAVKMRADNMTEESALTMKQLVSAMFLSRLFDIDRDKAYTILRRLTVNA